MHIEEQDMGKINDIIQCDNVILFNYFDDKFNYYPNIVWKENGKYKMFNKYNEEDVLEFNSLQDYLDSVPQWAKDFSWYRDI